MTLLLLSIECAALNAGIAQLVEHNLAKVGVASSNLVSRSSFVLLRLRLTGQELAGMSGRHLKCRDFNSAFSSKVFSL